jgi:hypothetical protein
MTDSLIVIGVIVFAGLGGTLGVLFASRAMVYHGTSEQERGRAKRAGVRRAIWIVWAAAIIFGTIVIVAIH